MMGPATRRFIDPMRALSIGSRATHTETIDDWLPDDPPVTTLLADPGRTLIDILPTLTVEVCAGQPVGGRFHARKATDAFAALHRWLERNPAATPGDRAAAENVVRDMQNALRGR